MKVYQVVRRGSKWHALMPDANPEVSPSEDKSRIVAWACEVAKKHDGSVQVRDIGGQIEIIYTTLSVLSNVFVGTFGALERRIEGEDARVIVVVAIDRSCAKPEDESQ